MCFRLLISSSFLLRQRDYITHGATLLGPAKTLLECSDRAEKQVILIPINKIMKECNSKVLKSLDSVLKGSGSSPQILA